MPFKNVFLSDDDADDRYFFQKAFDEVCSEHNLVMFDSNSGLMENLRNPDFGVPDFVFMDLNMPSLNGVECLRMISEMAGLNNTKVIIYSTIQSEAFIEEVRELGAAHFVTKPYDFYKLSNIIKYIIDGEVNAGNQYAPRDFIVSFESIKGKS